VAQAYNPTGEAEISRIQVQGEPQQKVCKPSLVKTNSWASGSIKYEDRGAGWPV
jgi:hypothetical protein